MQHSCLLTQSKGRSSSTSVQPLTPTPHQVRAGFDGMIVFYVEPPTFFGNKGETPCWIYDVIREEVSQPHRRFLVIDKVRSVCVLP